MSNYWQNRKWLEGQYAIQKTVDEVNAELLKQYTISFNRTAKHLDKLWQEMQHDALNGTLLVSDLYRFNRYYDLLNNLTIEMGKLGSKEQKLMKTSLSKQYTMNSAIIGDMLHINTSPNEAAMQKVLSSVWVGDGLNWSDRVWKNKELLKQTLEKGLVDCVATGASHTKLTKSLEQSFNMGFHNAERLARTELSYVQNQSCLDKYKEAGINKVKILSAGDSDVCDHCSEISGMVYPIGEEPTLPIHPNCRCSYLAVIE